MGIIAVFVTALTASFTVVSHFATVESTPDSSPVVSVVVESVVVPNPSVPTVVKSVSSNNKTSATSTSSPEVSRLPNSNKPTGVPTSTPSVQGVSQALVLSVTPTTPVTAPTDLLVPAPSSAPSITPSPTENPATPTPTAYVASPTQIDGWFEQFSREYGVDIGLLRKIAVCESGYNTNARSKHGYGGMYQFSESSWKSTRSHMGLDTNADLRFNAEEAIKTAAFKISRNGTGAWPACSK